MVHEHERYKRMTGMDQRLQQTLGSNINMTGREKQIITKQAKRKEDTNDKCEKCKRKNENTMQMKERKSTRNKKKQTKRNKNRNMLEQTMNGKTKQKCLENNTSITETGKQIGEPS